MTTSWQFASGAIGGARPGDFHAPENTVEPSVTGTALVGETVIIVPGTWTGTPSPVITRRVLSDGAPTAIGVSGLEITFDASYVDTVVTIEETAVNPNGTVVVTSDSFGPISATIANVTPLYIRRTAAGTADASSWANAAPLSQLNNCITGAGPGGTIYLRADEGDYTVTSTLNISHGGTTGNLVIIRGVDVNLANMEATIVGTRTTFNQPVDPEEATNVSAWTVGVQPFKLVAGADHLWWRYIRAEDVGAGFWRISAELSDMVVDHCTFFNCQQWIEDTVSSPATTASITGLNVSNCSGIGFAKQCIRLRYDSSDIHITDCDFDSARQTWLDSSGNFATGIVMDDTAHDITMTRVVCSNCHDTKNGNEALYWNADGFAAEDGNYGLIFDECEAYGNTDGGFDIKGEATFTNCISGDNKRNYRIWSGAGSSSYALWDTDLISCTSLEPDTRGGTGAACHLMAINHADILLTDFTATDTNAACVVYLNEEPNSVIRVASSTVNSLGTLETLDEGSQVVDASAIDSEFPVITTSPTLSQIENSALSTSVTGTDLHPITWALVNPGGAGGEDNAKCTLTLAGEFGMVAKDYETPIDADADGIYNVRLRCRDAARNTTYLDLAITITNDPAEPAVTNRYVRETAHGTQSGDSWANAAAFTSLNAMIALAGAVPDSKVYIRADEGDIEYTSSTNPITISHGGTAGHPVVVQGVDVDLTPTLVNFVTNRTAWTLPGDPETVTNIKAWAAGRRVFQLNAGANYLTFDYFKFTRCGDGCFIFNAAVHDVTISNWEFYNVKRFIETIHTDLTMAPYNIDIHDGVGVGFSENAIRIRAAAYDWTVTDVDCNSGRQDGDNFAMGLPMSDSAHDITLTRVLMRNCTDSLGGASSYWNADGFVSERGNDAITFDTCEAYGCTDAGFDLKSTNTVMTDCIASDNKLNLKLWGQATVTDMVLSSPHKRGGTYNPQNCECNSDTAMVRLIRPVFTATVTRQIQTNDGAQVLVDTPDITGCPASTTLSTYSGVSSGTGAIVLTKDGTDVTAPTIYTKAAWNWDEGLTFSQNIQATETVIVELIGGNDEARFSRTGQTISMSAKTYATPVDSDGNNVYNATIRVTDKGFNTANLALAVTIVAPALWTPTRLGSKVRRWYVASDLPPTTVSAWHSRINDNETLTASGSARPVAAATSFNSAYDGLTFDGTDDCLRKSSPPSFGSSEVIAIVDQTALIADTAQRDIFRWGNTGAATAFILSRSTGNQARVSSVAAALNDTDHVDFNGIHIIAGQWATAGTMAGRCDGRDFEPTASTAIASFTTTQNIRASIGSNNSSTAGNFFKGVIAEILFTSSLTTGEREQVEGYLAWKYGKQSLLPADHTYKSAAPV